jgi:hypothetical protein
VKQPKPRVTVERLREVLHYDPETGVFTWLPRPLGQFARLSQGKVWNVRFPGTQAGSPDKKGYIHIAIDKTLFKAHRLAFLYMTGEWPKHEVDHINQVKADNRWANLRDVPHQTNSQNARRARGSETATGLLGAYQEKDSGRFFASIGINGRARWLGYYSTAEAAHAAYVAAKREHHEGCTL